MIDIHTHLLPGVDDGSPNADHSALVLSRMLGEGVHGVVCTPHLDASRAQSAPFVEHAALLQDLRQRAPQGLAIHAGFEIMLDTSTFDFTDARLGLAGSLARLVEFPRRGLPANATEQLLRVRSQGLIPVVAHPERYRGCTTETIAIWRELGAVIQCDALALLGSGPMTDFAKSMLSGGLVDILASDNHGDRRSLAVCTSWLAEIGAGRQADLLARDNPGRLLAGEALLPVAPVSFHKGVFERLRELIFRPGRRPAAAEHEE